VVSDSEQAQRDAARARRGGNPIRWALTTHFDEQTHRRCPCQHRLATPPNCSPHPTAAQCLSRPTSAGLHLRPPCHGKKTRTKPGPSGHAPARAVSARPRLAQVQPSAFSRPCPTTFHSVQQQLGTGPRSHLHSSAASPRSYCICAAADICTLRVVAVNLAVFRVQISITDNKTMKRMYITLHPFTSSQTSAIQEQNIQEHDF
jgi:hypothetical protein